MKETHEVRRECDRAFARIAEGLVHYRHVDGDAPSLPTLMMHASPASSRSVEPLAVAVAQIGRGRVIAPDTPGNGDSVPLRQSEPKLGDYADAIVRMLDALEIERVNLYGFHTGAHIGIELAIEHPDRVGHLALDGLLWLEDSERAEFLAHYAPPLVADAWGTQIFQALQFIRDQSWFFPHFKRDPAHNLGGGAMPPELLHTLTVDLLKAAPSYHLAYRAVFRHQLAEQLPKLKMPVLLMADDGDPTRESVRRAASFVINARTAIGGEGWSPEGVRRKASRLLDFFGHNAER
jgi:pimeloyl-ACP methyl ester carboxylesterase